LAWLPAPLFAQTASLPQLRQQAAEAEKAKNWLEACKTYDLILRQDRTRVEAREGYQRCLRHFHQVRRHGDQGYRDAVAALKPSEAVDTYRQVFKLLAAKYVDRGRTNPKRLFQQGIQELRFALDEEVFRTNYHIKAEVIEAFKAELDALRDRPIESADDAAKEILALARTARKMELVPKSLRKVAEMIGPVFVLEFACGACNTLDEYSRFLTPSHFGDEQAALRGKFVGIGIDLAVVDQHLEIARVYPRSPAAEAGLLPRDRVLRIDRQPTDSQAPEAAADRLRGEPGSAIEVEVLSPSQMEPRSVKLSRRPVAVPSVEPAILQDGKSGLYFGHLRINHFQESTLQEVKEALAVLQTEGIQGLVLDLRGNPGGLFESSVQVSKLFLGSGVIVYTHGQVEEYNQPFKADSMNPFLMPMVVLVDGETASAAEVLAGALKENKRALVVGQTTYGKGTIQSFFPLDSAAWAKAPGGIRLTVAKFDSPAKVPYSGRGIEPDQPGEGEAALNTAVDLLRTTIEKMGMVMPMSMGGI
jgi:carboxyl-terminal processing protease